MICMKQRGVIVYGMIWPSLDVEDPNEDTWRQFYVLGDNFKHEIQKEPKSTTSTNKTVKATTSFITLGTWDGKKKDKATLAQYLDRREM